MSEPIEETVPYWRNRCEALDDALGDQRMIIMDLRSLLERMAYAIKKDNRTYAASVAEKATEKKLELRGVTT